VIPPIAARTGMTSTSAGNRRRRGLRYHPGPQAALFIGVVVLLSALLLLIVFARW